MKRRLTSVTRSLLLGAVVSLPTANPLAAEVAQSLAPALDRPPLLQTAPLRSLILDTLVDVARFRRSHPLSAGQQQAIREIILRHRAEILAQARSRLAAARMLRATVETPGVTDDAIREAARVTGSVIADGAVLRHNLIGEIQAVLQPGQIAAWHELLDRLEERLVATLEQV